MARTKRFSKLTIARRLISTSALWRRSKSRQPRESQAQRVAQAKQRVEQLREATRAYEQARDNEQAAQQAADAAEQQRVRDQQAARDREQKKREGMQLALSGMVLSGITQDFGALARMGGGGLLGWGGFAVEASVGIDGFLRLKDSEGTSATSFRLIDIGARWGPGSRSVGPFGSAGASFGVFFASPRERKVSGNSDVCSTVDTSGSNTCTFAVDANITTRLGSGGGSRSTRRPRSPRVSTSSTGC